MGTMKADYAYPLSPPVEVESEVSDTSKMASNDDTTPLMQSIPTPSTIATSPNRPQPSAIRRARSPPRNDDGDMVCDHLECQDKDETFKRLCEWNKHMDRHERPYKCNEPGCETSPGFTYSGGLLRHQREVHKMHLSMKSALFCPFHNCNRSESSGMGFTRRENLEEHKRRRHLEELSNDTQNHQHQHQSMSKSLPISIPVKRDSETSRVKKRKRLITPQPDPVDDEDQDEDADINVDRPEHKFIRPSEDDNDTALVNQLRMQIAQKDDIILRQALDIQQLQQFIKNMPTQALYSNGVMGSQSFMGHRGSIGGSMMQ